jgi:hypothetical protein
MHILKIILTLILAGSCGYALVWLYPKIKEIINLLKNICDLLASIDRQLYTINTTTNQINNRRG